MDLLDDLLLSRATLDRAALVRGDRQRLAALMTDARSSAIWVSGGTVAAVVDPSLCALVATPLSELDPTLELSFLGLDKAGRGRFAVHVPEGSSRELPALARWAQLREIGHRIDATDSGMAVTAVALDQWRASWRRCPRCGDPLQVTQAGWAMHCEPCKADHFPRTDPAVITLVRDRDDRALLGRHVRWQPGWMSTFAGFIEAGESAEAALRREIAEEAGVRVREMTYLGSQPWPFPRSLMLGYHAWTDDEHSVPDPEEIAETRWFTREALFESCERGETRLPPAVSISRKLIEHWFGEPLPGDWSREAATGR